MTMTVSKCPCCHQPAIHNEWQPPKCEHCNLNRDLTAENKKLQDQLKTERLSYKSLSEHVEVHEGELKEEVKELRGLVREMGRTIIALPADTKEIWDAANEILDRPKVKEIMKEGENNG